MSDLGNSSQKISSTDEISETFKKILVVRADRLGDVVVSTPVPFFLKEQFPNAEITFLVQEAWLPVLQFQPTVRVVGKSTAELREAELIPWLKAEAFDLALVLQHQAPIARAIRAAQIPVRIGPYSKFSSWFLYNRGVFQRRSSCRYHESEYNLRLLKALGVQKFPRPVPRVQISPQADLEAEKWLVQKGLREREFVVIHPGASGSSHYLTRLQLRELLEKTSSRFPVLVTAGPREQDLQRELTQNLNVHCFGDDGAKPLDVFAGVLKRSKAVFAHSTGPLHVASAWNVPVFAPFPVRRVLSAKRWGPLGQRAWTWTPGLGVRNFENRTADFTKHRSEWKGSTFADFDSETLLDFLGSL